MLQIKLFPAVSGSSSSYSPPTLFVSIKRPCLLYRCFGLGAVKRERDIPATFRFGIAYSQFSVVAYYYAKSFRRPKSSTFNVLYKARFSWQLSVCWSWSQLENLVSFFRCRLRHPISWAHLSAEFNGPLRFSLRRRELNWCREERIQERVFIFFLFPFHDTYILFLALWKR